MHGIKYYIQIITIALFSLIFIQGIDAAEKLVWSDEFNGTSLDLSKWDQPEYNRRINSNGPDGWWLKKESYNINKVKLSWAKDFGKEYKIEVSEGVDGPWTECVHITDNMSLGTVTHEFPSHSGRYIRKYGIKSGTQAGFSIWEMAVYGEKNTTVGSADQNEVLNPKKPTLLQNYPNPFNTTTVFRYQVPEGHVRLKIHNLNGQIISSLADEEQACGDYSVTWNVMDMTSGIYVARLQMNDEVMTHKINVLK